MKKTKNHNQICRGCVILLLAGVLLSGFHMDAYAAADSPSLDWSMSGQSSITVDMEDVSGNAVTSGTLTLYRIADLEQDDGDMVYTFTDAFSACGYTLDDVMSDSSSLASGLAAYVSENGITGTAVENTDGTVVFDDLTLGFYLIVQTTESEGYYAVNPFVVSVPLDVDDEWVYTVDASPKMGILTPSPETPSTPSQDTPTETSVHTPLTGTTLPQTGQLFWPIPLLAACGAALMIAGWVLQRRSRGKAVIQ